MIECNAEEFYYTKIFSLTGDDRFAFLNKGHQYYPYYKCKIKLYSEVYGDIFKKTSEVCKSTVFPLTMPS